MQTFGEHLKRWRSERGLSQLALASRVETSTRHLSFLESGRSTPKREMVLRLACALKLAPHERDRALESVGLHPDLRQPPPDGAGLVVIERAVATLLENHDPLPAYAMDINWKLLRANVGGARLLSAIGPPILATAEKPSERPTLVELLIGHANSDSIDNWMEVTALALARARAELARRSDPPVEFLAGIEQLESLHADRLMTQLDQASYVDDDPQVQVIHDGMATDRVTTKVAVPLRIRTGDVTLSLISMVAQFGGIDYLDVDAPRVELMFPEDLVTVEWFESGGLDYAGDRVGDRSEYAHATAARAGEAETGC